MHLRIRGSSTSLVNVVPVLWLVRVRHCLRLVSSTLYYTHENDDECEDRKLHSRPPLEALLPLHVVVVRGDVELADAGSLALSHQSWISGNYQCIHRRKVRSHLVPWTVSSLSDHSFSKQNNFLAPLFLCMTITPGMPAVDWRHVANVMIDRDSRVSVQCCCIAH